jgi:predicted CopG family antitoxin
MARRKKDGNPKAESHQRYFPQMIMLGREQKEWLKQIMAGTGLSLSEVVRYLLDKAKEGTRDLENLKRESKRRELEEKYAQARRAAEEQERRVKDLDAELKKLSV